MIINDIINIIKENVDIDNISQGKVSKKIKENCKKNYIENRQNNEEIRLAISEMIPASWNFATKICDLDGICANPGTYENKNVYATEVLITSNLTMYNPKKLRFFVWGK